MENRLKKLNKVFISVKMYILILKLKNIMKNIDKK